MQRYRLCQLIFQLVGLVDNQSGAGGAKQPEVAFQPMCVFFPALAAGFLLFLAFFFFFFLPFSWPFFLFLAFFPFSILPVPMHDKLHCSSLPGPQAGLSPTLGVWGPLY